MSFKLLAIRPLEGCNPKFLKNLEENRIYKFYNDYEFQDEKGNVIDTFGKENYFEVNKIKHNPTVPDNLYGDKINISAIVGKNGSGKSSLVELLYVFFYQLSISEEIIKLFDFSRIVDENLIDKKYIDSFKLNKGDQKNRIFDNEEEYKSFMYSINDSYEEYLIHLEPKVEYNNKNFKTENFEIIKHIKEWKYYFDNKLIYNIGNLFLEIYYENNGKYYLLKSDKESFSKVKNFELLNNFWQEIKIIDKNIFYNLAVNYSLYGLNSNELGDWVGRVFHKNDGYQTPIVINPYRENGNININSENELVRDRILTNILLNEKLVQLTENSRINELIIKLKNRTLPDEAFVHSIFFDDDVKIKNKFIKSIIDFFNSNKELQPENKFYKDTFLLNSIDDQCIWYIFTKLKKISRNYKIYEKFLKLEKDHLLNIYNIDSVSDFLNELSKDYSHISYKIRQAINFIVINKLEENQNDLVYSAFKGNYPANKLVKDISLSDFSEKIIERNKQYNIEIICLLPPSIFEIDYTFDNGSSFSMLSSGEKQQIFSINSILYHLINLNSAFENNFPYKYPYINLILDEIELYAHPEMQRKYISELLVGINKLETKNILGINILFITHSPFILSDIPKQNVLFLDSVKKVDNNGQSILDKESKEQFFSTSISYKGDNTFAENIHEMLTDGFFISSTKGAFVTAKINAFLSDYKKWISINKDNKNYLVNKGKYEEKKEHYIDFIALIGEKYIRTMLENHLSALTEHFEDVSHKEIRINFLREEKNRIENELNKLNGE
jgi:hypothetical protein